MGMGLSIVRTIVTTLRGEIDLENQNGAIFRVRLPLA
jgi:signal transduction histidine kinase